LHCGHTPASKPYNFASHSYTEKLPVSNTSGSSAWSGSRTDSNAADSVFRNALILISRRENMKLEAAQKFYGIQVKLYHSGYLLLILNSYHTLLE
jgi:hypothetical protein